jgi:hypothetical protein
MEEVYTGGLLKPNRRGFQTKVKAHVVRRAWYRQEFRSKQHKEISMKSTWVCLLIGTLSLSSAVWPQNSTAGTEKAVAALEQQWLQSQKTNNPDLAAPLLADKFINTDSDGKATSKAEFLAQQKATKFDSVSYDDLKVMVIGEAAIATGVFRATRTMRPESP